MKTLMINCLRILGLLIVIGLASCSDNDGDRVLGTSDTANGIWEGTVTVDGDDTFKFTALLYNGRFMAFNSDSFDFMLDGDYTVRSNDISGKIKTYDLDDQLEVGVATGETVTISGTVDEQKSIALTFSTSEGATGTISLTFNAAYNRSSSLSLIAGTWLSIGLTITVDDDGSVEGQDDDGCIFSGDISILDSEHNLYKTKVSVESCGEINGSYTGFATLPSSDTAVIAASNSDYFLLVPFIR